MPRRLKNLLMAVLLVGGLYLAADTIGRTLQPWRYASVPWCLGYDKAAGDYRNKCDFAINAGFVQRRITAPPKQDFPHVRLEPGETTDAWRAAVRNMPAGSRFYHFSCKAPHIPADLNDPDKAGRIVTKCRRGDG